MKVMKFGGTSVGSPERIKNVASLVTKSGEQTFVVLSAMSGTTNSLVEISDYLYRKNPESANELINALEKKYVKHVEELFSTEEYKQKTLQFISEEFDYLRSFTKDLFTSYEDLPSLLALMDQTTLFWHHEQPSLQLACIPQTRHFSQNREVEQFPH